MSHRNWKIAAFLVFILLLAVFLVACTSEQAENVGELVLRCAGRMGCI